VRRKTVTALPLLFVLSQVLTVALFFVSSRYRQPLIPAMAIFAAAAVMQFRLWIKEKKQGDLVRYGVILVLLVIVLNPPVTVASRQNRSMYHALVGNVLANQNRNDLAVTELNDAVAVDSANTLAYYYLGMVYGKTGRFDDAIGVLKKAEALNPAFGKVLLLLMRVHFDKGDYRGALIYYNKALDTDVDPQSAYLANWMAARSSLYIGNKEDAQALLKRILEFNPADQAAKSLQDSLKVN
jgi:tetratricopeptide (TPR) repeat protein